MNTVENNIKDRYFEFLNLLSILCECYDSTEKEYIAISISVAIRVLVHDTFKKNGEPNSTSLLTLMQEKDRKYLSTNIENLKEDVHLGLVRRVNVGVKNGVGGEAKYWPLCDEKYFPMRGKFNYFKFDKWWEEIVFKSSSASLTRQDLVLQMAHKDGGAHVARKVDEKYDLFRKSWSGGSTLVGISSGVSRGYDNIPTYPAIRQIAYELLSSLQS